MARRFANNEETIVTANDFDRNLAEILSHGHLMVRQIF